MNEHGLKKTAFRFKQAKTRTQPWKTRKRGKRAFHETKHALTNTNTSCKPNCPLHTILLLLVCPLRSSNTGSWDRSLSHERADWFVVVADSLTLFLFRTALKFPLWRTMECRCMTFFFEICRCMTWSCTDSHFKYAASNHCARNVLNLLPIGISNCFARTHQHLIALI